MHAPRRACRRLDAALVTGNKARQRQRHVERVLHVMVGRVATLVAGITAGEKALEIVERKPQFVERCAGKGLGKQFVNGIANRCRIADLHGVGDVVIVTSILRHSAPAFFLCMIHGGQTAHRYENREYVMSVFFTHRQTSNSATTGA